MKATIDLSSTCRSWPSWVLRSRAHSFVILPLYHDIFAPRGTRSARRPTVFLPAVSMTPHTFSSRLRRAFCERRNAEPRHRDGGRPFASSARQQKSTEIESPEKKNSVRRPHERSDERP